MIHESISSFDYIDYFEIPEPYMSNKEMHHRQLNYCIVGEQSITHQILRRRLALIIHTNPKESPKAHNNSFRYENRYIVILLNISTSENHHHAVTPTQQHVVAK